MSQVARSWLAFAAMGAGVILLALVLGQGVPVGVALVVLGSFEFGWGVAVLARDRVVVPQLIRLVVVVPAVGWIGFLVLAVILKKPEIGSVFPFFPMAVSSLFGLGIALTVSLQLRRQISPARPERPARNTAGPYRYLFGLLLGALMISALTTPALAATQAGVNNPHSHHGELNIRSPHSGH